jgi:hypothetical protein
MDITYRGRQIGSINPSATVQPSTQKGFDLVTVGIPLDFRFEACQPGAHWMLADLAVDLLVQRPNAETWLLGSGLHPEMFMSATGAVPLARTVNIRCSPRGLAQYEAFRNGGPVRLRCEVRGKICALINVGGNNHLSNPSTVFGSIEIEFPRTNWTDALGSCGLSTSVLIEVPLPPAGGPDDGRGALRDAFEAFNHGGATAWKNAVGHIRPYLEEWKDQEPLSKTEPRDGSVADRNWKLLNLRDALHRCCHFWVHESKSSCTRQDALLVLTTFASLLQAR